MRVLYLYPSLVEDEVRKVSAGDAPTDRLYGLIELRRLGHQVDIADSRFRGRFGRLVKTLRRYSCNICDVATIRQIRRYDVVVVKDDFSPMVTAACRLAGVRVVYLDALFQVPRRRWKRAFYRANILQADAVVAYSHTQIALWRKEFGLGPEAISYLPYAIDGRFYAPVPPPAPAPRPYVLSIGRDVGRSFATLVAAMDGLPIDLKLVTLPYLLRDVDTNRPWIEVRQRLPYDELFRLYAGALLVAIPLKGGMTYPSGIRGLLEAMSLGSPAVATRTPVLEEYVPDGEGVVYVDADDTGALRRAIERLAADEAARTALAGKGRALVQSRYTMERFGRSLEACLEGRS